MHPWVSADYLLWWVKKGPLPAPLLTAGSLADAVPGALGQPGTVVLYGVRDVDFNTFSGLRLNAGMSFGDADRFGVEGGYFRLEQRAQSVAVASNGSGNPLLARPLFDVFGAGEFDEATSFPGALAGRTAINSTTQLQGWDVNLSANVYQGDGFGLTLLAGFRSLDLNERQSIQDSLTPLVPGAVSLRGSPVSPPSLLTDFDSFHTSNKFYGGQVGGRLAYGLGNLRLEAVAKLGMGVTQELTVISGATSVLTPGAAPVTALGGILAQPTNIGRHFHQPFSLVPEGTLNVGYQVTSWLQLRVGYSGLYWTNVERPGNAIDRTVNINQIVSDQRFSTLPGGLPRPVFTPQQSDFWAHGITFGFQLDF